MTENLTGYRGNKEEEDLTSLGQRRLPGGSGAQAKLVVGVTLEKKGGKDIPNRSNISKVVGKETASGPFRNGEFGDAIHRVLEPHFHSRSEALPACSEQP